MGNSSWAAYLSCILALPAFAQGDGCKSTATGDVRSHKLASKIFENTRTIRVWLPPGYDEPPSSEQRYPVLYMLDGQNLFDACLSGVSNAEWEIDETMNRLVREGKVPAMIIVGIDHANERRAHEYLPYKDYVANPDMEEPVGKRFPDFLVHEVMPLIEGRYRTLTGHANTGIGGSSYGGIASLYALLARPNVFGYAILESPSIAIGMGQMIRDTNPLIALPQKVFMAFGGKEIDNPLIQRRVIDLFDIVESNFHSAGYDDSNFRFTIDPEGRHRESDWARRFPDAIKFLFADWKQQ